MNQNETNQILASGSCTDTISWELSEDSATELCTLKVFGEGEMPLYISEKDAPWHQYRAEICKLEISEGITSTGDNAFKDMEKLSDVTLPETLEILGNVSFSTCPALVSIKIPDSVRIIGQKCFAKCSSLKEVSIPRSLEGVDFKAFQDCDVLKKVRFAGTRDEFDKINVSFSARGNIPFQTAMIYFDGVSEKYTEMTSEIADIIANGGDGKMHIIFPDITVRNSPGKQGDCSLILFPNGETMLVDNGMTENRPYVLRFIRDIGLRKIDKFVISHPHSDHLGNSVAVSKLIYEELGGSISSYYSPGYNLKELETPAMTYLTEKGTEFYRNVRAGDIWQIGDAKVELFNPSEYEMEKAPDIVDAAINNISLTMKITFGQSSYMTSGDLYASEEVRLCEIYGDRLHVDVAKANHHARFTSNSPVWIDTLSPLMILSSADDSGTYTMIESLCRKGIKYYSTYDTGLVHLSFGKNKDYTVKTEK